MADQDQRPALNPPDAPSAHAPRLRGRSRLLDTALLGRWRRRKLIREIEAETGRRLLCYVSVDPSVVPRDAYDFTQLVQTVDSGASITLLLDSPGGDVDSAEKIVQILRGVCQPPSGPSGDLEVVVPYRAKSAATLIALGADRILMSDSSELGPIDPQFKYANGSLAAFAVIRAYERAEERSRRHPNNPAFAEALAKFDPVLIEVMRLAVSRSRACAERLLKRQGGNYTAAPAILTDVDRFPSHGQTIDWRTALEIGIPQVRPIDQASPLWQRYWRLYCDLLRVCGMDRRAFASRDLTLLGP